MSWDNGLEEAIKRLEDQHFNVPPATRNWMDCRDRAAFKYICECARAAIRIAELWDNLLAEILKNASSSK